MPKLRFFTTFQNWFTFVMGCGRGILQERIYYEDSPFTSFLIDDTVLKFSEKT
jgi:hypothetical protein